MTIHETFARIAESNDDAQTKLQKMAGAYQLEHPEKTAVECFSAACLSNPELHKRYLNGEGVSWTMPRREVIRA